MPSPLSVELLAALTRQESVMQRILRTLLIVAAMGGTAVAHARPYDFEGVNIDVPSPPGFLSTSRYPNLYRTAEELTPQRVLLLDHFLPLKDAPKDVNATHWDPTSWMQVQTPRGARAVELTQERFERLKAVTKSMDIQQQVESQHPGVLKSVGIDEVKLMGVNEDTPEWFMYSTALKTGRGSVPVIHVASYCRIKGRLVILNSYRVLRSAGDVKLIHQEARIWATAVLNANRE